MAGTITATVIQKMFSEYSEEGIGKFTDIAPKVGAYQAHVDDTEMLLTPENIQDIKDNVNNPSGIAIDLLAGETITIGSGISSCTATNEGPDSAIQNVTYTTLSTDFTMNVDKLNFNRIEENQYYEKAIKQRIIAFQKSLETLSIANLAAKQGQLQAEPYLLGYFADGGTNEYSIPLAEDEELFMNYLNEQYEVMGLNQYGNVRVIANPSAFAKYINKTQAQGTANATNLRFQYDNNPNIPVTEGIWSGKDFYKSTAITNALSTDGTAFATARGSLGVVGGVDRKYRKPLPSNNDYTRYVDSLPGLPGIEIGIKEGVICTGGEFVLHVTMEFSVAFLSAYVGDLATDVSPVNKYQFATA